MTGTVRRLALAFAVAALTAAETRPAGRPPIVGVAHGCVSSEPTPAFRRG